MTHIPTDELIALLDQVIERAACLGATRSADVGNSEVKQSDAYKILAREISRGREKAH